MGSVGHELDLVGLIVCQELADEGLYIVGLLMPNIKAGLSQFVGQGTDFIVIRKGTKGDAMQGGQDTGMIPHGNHEMGCGG